MASVKGVHTHIFKVRGSGAFPIDMLRRDKCYPRSEADANAAERSRRYGEDGQERDVTLERTSPSPLWVPCVGRWLSYGWRVVEMQYVTPKGCAYPCDVEHIARAT